MGKRIDLTNMIFGKLKVISDSGLRTKSGDKKWKSICECGNFAFSTKESLFSGRAKSCGCLRGKAFKHKMTNSGAYKTWLSMRRRCYDSKRPDSKSYSKRGITVCKRWEDFNCFYEDMGDRPKGKTLDRIDNDGNYEKSNCRWATSKEQGRNRRNNLKIKYNGKMIAISELSEKTKIPESTLRGRIQRGLSIDLITYNGDLRKSGN